VVKHLCDSGINPDEIAAVISWNKNAFRYFDGKVDSETYMMEFIKQNESLGRKSKPTRYFCKDHQLIYANNRTYALTKMWGRRTVEALELITNKWSDLSIEFYESEG
jgi:hypothetical protein